MSKELSFKLVKNYFKNYLKVKFKKHQILEPLFFTFYNTLKCNFSCSYCDFANKKNEDSFPELDTQETMKLLQIIKDACLNLNRQSPSQNR
jgi:hypothetical protein